MSEQYGKGALEDSYDIRDYQYAGSSPFDCQAGFNVLDVVGNDLVTKDQNGSYSCGGQAWAYYGEVLETVATGTYEPRSARWIYSQTFVEGGGSSGRNNSDVVTKQGWALEKHALSYDNGKPPREAFMRLKPFLSPEAKESMEVSKALSYLQVRGDIDVVAQAIRDNYGCVITLAGQDNGTWRSEFPKPPNNKDWFHHLYCGKAKMIGGKKYIAVKNSWGNDTGKEGWQWIGEEYFTTGNVRGGWTLQWDYRPAKIKVLMQQVIKLMKLLLGKK